MRRLHSLFGVTIAGASLVAIPPVVAPMPAARVRAVQLISGDTADSPLGDGTALVLGGSGLPTPGQPYADVVDSDYLAPRDFSGTTQIVTTPEGALPVFGSLWRDVRTIRRPRDNRSWTTAILNQIAGGNVDAANPVDVFGYSQSSVISSLLMPELASQGVHSDDVHFVLVGDESAPNGGILERFDLPAGTQPTIPSLGLTFSGPEASDL